ncbi:MAG TPA: carboxypeptidase regulatory-like domain-containing protein, partial [Bryobacteraceae bacterium]|nr:carboxypeptidase regulatory-like domain-containing protein [Bryobacteraceae bacterium]
MTHKLTLSTIWGLILEVSIGYAQITGELRGTITDSSGSAVAGAKISLRNLENGGLRDQVANSEGGFTFNLLQIGRYEIRAEAPGFRASVTQAEVKTGEVASVHLQLEIGQVTETVTVSDAVVALDTQNAQLQTSVTGAAIQEIPVNRNPNLFALTAPGVTPVSSNNPFLGSGSFNSNGGRGRGNNITVDGITATDVSVTGTGGPLGPLNFSAIKEVKVITNNFNAEYGRNSSAQLMYITKNGTNELHGELYEYLQNDKLNARPFFDTTGKTNIVRTNTYGFEAGGPVYLPKIMDGRNKFFWHAAYEGYKNRGVGATRIARVPTPAQLASVTDATSRQIVQQYQVPSAASGQITTSAPAKTDTYQFSIRGDVNLSKSDTLWARYSIYDSVANSSGLTFVDTNLPGFGASSTNHPRQATLAETHVFGSSAVNEFRFGFGQSKPGFPIDTPYPLGVRVNFNDGSVAGLGVSSILPQGREQRTYQFTDNFSIVRGQHNFKFGGEYYSLAADSFFDNLIRPVITFTTFADFAAGLPASFSQNFGNSVRANRVKNFFAFAQDDWKVTRNLTLNIGLRMEYAGGPMEANGLISNLNLDDKTAYGAAGSGPFGLMEVGKPSFKSNYNWGPRLGFAYMPFNSTRTVIRGGYGIAYDFVFLNPITNQRFLPPFIIGGSLQGQ